ncbi:MAG TPA: tRNA (adenosine(37)-N6)-threonylcarbamoyltransferase complex dimerization subunit type 1 TsaB [Alphaproteobacteria bacterium]|nr:tRNA (adenosine(37)-N6)-threonylcarbamoyltransferase complex dimerization subunit type 1 TsaB [Alphaproteobacteria bacterium]
MRKILAIDCAHGDCSAALGDGDEIVSEIDEQMERGQAERLIPMVRDVLKKAGASFADVDAVAVTTGPGSFTGVRVGLAAADGIALAAGLPMIGVSVLDVLAWKASRRFPETGKLCLILETKRDDYYVQCFENGAPTTEAAALTAAEIKPFVESGHVCAGNGVDRYAGENGGVPVCPVKMPTAGDVALFAASKQPRDAFPAPLYLREAEVTPCRK